MSSVAKKLLEVDSHDPGWEEAWTAEAVRRSQAAQASGDTGRPWSEVKAEMLAKLPPR